MLDCLDWLAAWASHLIRRVGGVETLSVLPGKGMSCNKAVKGGVGESQELNFVLISVMFGGVRWWSCGARVWGEGGMWGGEGLEGVVKSPVWGFKEGSSVGERGAWCRMPPVGP